MLETPEAPRDNECRLIFCAECGLELKDQIDFCSGNCEYDYNHKKTMKEKAISAIKVELASARIKEVVALQEYINAVSSGNDTKKVILKEFVDEARGYTNGLLQALEAVRGVKEEV